MSRGALAIALALIVALGAPPSGRAADASDPSVERHAFQQFFHEKFPNLPLNDFAGGPYAVDPKMRRQWQDIMQMPPYDFAVDEGKHLFEMPFHNGKTYASCLRDGGLGTRQLYPYFDSASGHVITLPLALNACRVANGEKALSIETGPIASIAAYLASTSRGKPFAIVVGNDPRALAAFEDGRERFLHAQGNAQASCASCHMQGAGVHPGGPTLAPALGILAAFPIYSSGWGAMGTAARRIRSCDAGMGNKPQAPDAPAYRDLEYFLSFMSNGIAVAGPGARP